MHSGMMRYILSGAVPVECQFHQIPPTLAPVTDPHCYPPSFSEDNHGAKKARVSEVAKELAVVNASLPPPTATNNMGRAYLNADERLFPIIHILDNIGKLISPYRICPSSGRTPVLLSLQFGK